VTEPDLLTPLELQAPGRLLARVARSTGKVRRGAGAARQDVNVSVAGGRRVEIKGVYHHRGLPRLVHVEAFRQLNLLRIRAELHRRNVVESMLAVPDKGNLWDVSSLAIDAGPALRDCDFAPIRDALSRGETVCAVRLPGFADLLSRRTQPGVTFAREFADRVRVIACPEHRPFMIHSDIRDYGLDPQHWRAIRKQAGADRGDAVIVVWGLEPDMATAAREILIRARDALAGVPSETRQAFRDGTNGFERILPGPDRMYPDTDTPPLPIPDSLVEKIRLNARETPWHREQRYEVLGLPFDAARRLAASAWADLFDALAPREPGVARRVAGALGRRLPWHLRNGTIASVPEPPRLEPLVRAITAGEIRLEALDRALDALLTHPDDPPAAVLERFRRRDDDERELDDALATVARAAAALDGRSWETRVRWAMGPLMRVFLGRLDPNVVRERIERELSMAGAGRVA
jgi:glutamyl-tRNA(Gln) amidotransferase subunit E